MTEPRRALTTGEEAALMVLSRGGCYKPGCGVPAVVEVEPGRWTLNLQRAHIAARESTGARYADLPPDQDPDTFANIILLCIPHHLLVDRLEPEKYSAALLRRWKTEREQDGQATLSGLTNVTEERLQNMLASAIDGYHERMQELITRIARFDSETALMLRQLSNELSDFRSVQYAADPDVAATLWRPARRLPDPDTAAILSRAADKLAGLNADTLNRIDQAARRLQQATSRLPER